MSPGVEAIVEEIVRWIGALLLGGLPLVLVLSVPAAIIMWVLGPRRRQNEPRER